MHDVIKVFVVDDSALVRQALSEIINGEPQCTLMGIANDPIIAMEKFKKFGLPDVLILDIEMPRMNGLEFLKKLMRETPLPVIICSSTASLKSKNAIEALSIGAVKVIQKPEMGVKDFFQEYKQTFINAIKSANNLKIKKTISLEKYSAFKKEVPFKKEVHPHPFVIEEKKSADEILPLLKKQTVKTTTIIGIGASTGGVQTIEKILMPISSPLTPPIVIVQHMPAGFTKSFASRLNSLCTIHVKEAEDGDKLLSGRVLIAPGDQHLTIKRISNSYVVELKDGEKVSRHKPSVDVLFRSLANEAGENAIGIILTGMGSDGAFGLKELKERGGKTYAQNAESCVVFGMPKEALKIGATETTLSPNEITEYIKKQ